MPARTRIDPATHLFVPVDPTPDAWHVDFDACASGAGAVEFRWSVEGDGSVHATSSCTWEYDFSSEGAFRVSLTIVRSDGPGAPIVQDVTVQDFLIVAVGDSYGSGEGAPDVAIEPTAFEVWSQATIAHAQALVDLAEADRLLGIISDINEPLTRLIDANALLADAHGRLWHCAIPFDPGCAEANWDIAVATARITAATADLTYELTVASVEEGFGALRDLLPTPSALRTKLNELSTFWTTARDLARGTIAAAQLVFDRKDDMFEVVWQDEACHRSALSGQAQAALELEESDPRTSVTFVHRACSGATLAGARGQIDEAKTQIGDREVDALLVSAGGNDAYFAKIIMACVTQEPCHNPPVTHQTLADVGFAGFCLLVSPFTDVCDEYQQELTIAGGGTSAADLFGEGSATLPGAYALLAAKAAGLSSPVPLEPARLYLTEYPNATQDETGNICGPRPDRVDPLVNLPGLSPPEWAWAGETVTRQGLNARIAEATVAHGWSLVGGIFDAYAKHGYCSDSSWFVRVQDSFYRQLDFMGTAHPTREGQATIGDRILATLRPDLYPGIAPRTPQVLPVARAGGPWILDEGSTAVLENGSMDPSKTSLAFEWTLDVAPAGAARLDEPTVRAPALTGVDDGTGTVAVRVRNAWGEASATAEVVVRNVAPTVEAGPDVQLVEGETVAVASSVVDPGATDTLTANLHWGDGSAVESGAVDGRVFTATHRYLDEGSFLAKVVVRDDDGGAGTDSFHAVVLNAPPVLAPLIGPAAPALPGTPVRLSATFADPGVLDTHVATWTWDDGVTSSGTLTETGGAGEVVETRAFASAGVYTATLVVSDDDGASAAAQLEVIVIDPGAGFVTGAGWAEAPTGSDATDPTASGGVHFVFHARYLSGDGSPSGTADVRFGFGGRVQATALRWLVVRDALAELRADADLDGVPGHELRLTIRDGRRAGGPDGLRVQVRGAAGEVILDTAPGTSDRFADADPPMISAGNVAIH